MKILILLGLVVQIFGRYVHREIRSVSDGDYRAVDRYLEQFGYMAKAKSLAVHTVSERTRSLKAFQKFAGLPITGKLDDATIAKMNTPRCGVPDMVTTAGGLAKPFNLGPKWTKKVLTWRIDQYTSQLNNEVTRSELARALKAWSDVADITFTEVTTGGGSVDIDIGFYSGDHGDGYPFDGPGSVLAHAFYPQDGRSHFDDQETWVVNRSGIDLFIVGAHEFGHALGLGHSENNDALMAPYYTGYKPGYKLHPDDIAGIQAHYGAASTQAPTPAPTPSSTTRATRGKGKKTKDPKKKGQITKHSKSIS